MAIEIRPAAAGDVEAIAARHAESWRSSYRGTFSDPYLDGEVPAERAIHIAPDGTEYASLRYTRRLA